MARRWVLAVGVGLVAMSAALPVFAVERHAPDSSHLASQMAGMGIALMLVVVTVVFWDHLFENAATGSVTAGLWVMLLISGPLGIIFALAIFGWVIYLRREVFMRWYYLLTPHPVEKLVDRVLQDGEPLDADAFAEAIRTSGENPVELAVRAEQVAAVTKRWREHEQALRANEANIIDSERERAASESALLQAQTEALEAAIAHQLAAARLEELQRNQRR